jgi:hypothetical protein
MRVIAPIDDPAVVRRILVLCPGNNWFFLSAAARRGAAGFNLLERVTTVSSTAKLPFLSMLHQIATMQRTGI